MGVEVKVPSLPESVSQADLVSWLKKEGDPISRDENLVDIETDKVMIEIPSPVDGVLKKILRPDGATVQAGDVVAIVEPGVATATPEKTSVAAASSPAPVQAASAPSAPAVAPSSEKPVMPAARKLLEEQSMRAEQVSGSGRGGRVTKQDVLAAVSTGTALPAKAARSEKRVPMTRLRQRIAERLLDSQASCAILTTFNEVNMQPVMDVRKKYQELFTKKHGVRLGFMSFFVKAVVQALKAFPVINASIDGTDVVYHDYFDIGIAVSSPRGLVVPIIRDADQLSMAQIEQCIADYAEKAKTGRLSIEDMTGGTFTISNGGAFGSMMSTPIINPPQSAILGMHAVKERPVVENGQIVIRPMNYLAVSYDHRLIDGREAVLFLVTIKDLLEDPVRFLIEE